MKAKILILILTFFNPIAWAGVDSEWAKADAAGRKLDQRIHQQDQERGREIQEGLYRDRLTKALESEGYKAADFTFQTGQSGRLFLTSSSTICTSVKGFCNEFPWNAGSCMPGNNGIISLNMAPQGGGGRVERLSCRSRFSGGVLLVPVSSGKVIKIHNGQRDKYCPTGWSVVGGAHMCG